jgi:hypothetical protein
MAKSSKKSIKSLQLPVSKDVKGSAPSAKKSIKSLQLSVKKDIKKTKKGKKRKVNRWIQLKSLIWGQVKNEGVYDYRSSEFNSLVSKVYDNLGYRDSESQVYDKDPKSLGKKVIYALHGTIDSASYQESSQAIVYYQINDKLNEYKDNSKYNGWKVENRLTSPLPMASQFNLDTYNYYKTGLRNFVSDLDRQRRLSGNMSTPEPTVKITASEFSEKIIISDLNDDTPVGKALSKKAITGQTLSPHKMKSLYKKVKELKEKLSSLKKDGKATDKVLSIEMSKRRRDKKLIASLSNKMNLNVKEQKASKAELKMLENQVELNKKAIAKARSNKRKKK